MSLSHKSKTEVLPPRNAMALDTLAGVRGEMARLYRLALNGRMRIRSDEMTRSIYALKEIRACLERRRELVAKDVNVLRRLEHGETNRLITAQGRTRRCFQQTIAMANFRRSWR
jgi:hypothetical protein